MKFSETPCSRCDSIDWWRQQTLATSKIQLSKHLTAYIQFWKWVLWSFKCFLLYIASPNQDTASFYCLWHIRKYYPHCVCNTLCFSLHTSEALELICTLKRIFLEIFLPISDLLKKALYNSIYPFLKGASVSYKLGRIVMSDCSFFPTPSYRDECKGAYFSLMQVFYLCISVPLLSPICMFESFLGFTEVLNHRFKSKIAEKTKELFSLGHTE